MIAEFSLGSFCKNGSNSWADGILSSIAVWGIAENAGGSCGSNSSAFFHGQLVLRNHAQNNLTQDRLSTAPANAIASADNVLTATFLDFSRMPYDGIDYTTPIFPNSLMSCHNDHALMGIMTLF